MGGQSWAEMAGGAWQVSMLAQLPPGPPAFSTDPMFVSIARAKTTTRRKQTSFERQGKPWFFLGTNMWGAAILASTAAGRARLGRELDRMANAGLRGVRVMALSEGAKVERWRVSPTSQDGEVPGVFNAEVEAGLDHLLVELGKRGMVALLVLGNFCARHALATPRLIAHDTPHAAASRRPRTHRSRAADRPPEGCSACSPVLRRPRHAPTDRCGAGTWSGGMAQYVSWANPHERHPPELLSPRTKDKDWDAYAGYAARFYDDPKAYGLWYLAVARLVGRRNSISGTLYRDDPAIMGWQLANEPRPMTHRQGYERWVRQSAALIKSIDPAHLVTIGSEGETPYKDYVHADFVKDHKTPGIDFATVHIWPANWGWYSPDGVSGDLRNAQVRSIDYLNRHVKFARDDLRVPLLLEEFGFPRDGGSCEAGSGTSRRNSYYATLLDATVASAAGGGPLAGALFWGWGGEGRPRERRKDCGAGGEPAVWKPGDDLLSDPPHESQGWYSVFDSDSDTLKLLRRTAARTAAVA